MYSTKNNELNQGRQDTGNQGTSLAWWQDNSFAAELQYSDWNEDRRYQEGDVHGEKWTDRLPNAFNHVENGISGLNSPIKRDPHVENNFKSF